MADISKITLPSGTTYNIKDESARADIATLQTSVTGAMHYAGVTTTAISDGSTTNPITINNASYTAKNGDVVIYGTKEYVFSTSDNKWHEFGSTGSLKALAFKDSASGSFTPAGTVSKPTFSGTARYLSVTATPSGTVSVSTNGTANKTATVSAASSGTATYTPSGTVSKPTFTGTEATLTYSYEKVGVSLEGSSTQTAPAAVDITPAGTNTGTAVTLNTTTVNSITAVGTLPSFTATVANETLTLGFSAGTLPTKGSNTTVATSVKSVTQPTFTGTAKYIDANVNRSTQTGSITYTPYGTVSQPTFTGTGARLVTGNIPVPSSYTATFNGDAAWWAVGSATSNTRPSIIEHGDETANAYTPAGTISTPTFTGTKGTVTVS